MKKLSNVIKWLVPVLLVVSASLLSWGLGWIVPDYKGRIRTIEYDVNGMISIAEQDDEIELYPWNEYQEESCVYAFQWEGIDEVYMEENMALLWGTVEILCSMGAVEEYEHILNRLLENLRYAPGQERFYLKDVPFYTDQGEQRLDLAWRWNNVEYFEIYSSQSQGTFSDSTEQIRHSLQQMLEEFRGVGKFYSDVEETDGGEAYRVYDDLGNHISSVIEVESYPDLEENVFRNFLERMQNLEKMSSMSVSWLMEEVIYDSSCEMIPYQGKFLLVFSGEEQDISELEVILIYDDFSKQISGCSIRF